MYIDTKSQMTKLSERNKGEHLCDLGYTKIFLTIFTAFLLFGTSQQKAQKK